MSNYEKTTDSFKQPIDYGTPIIDFNPTLDLLYDNVAKFFNNPIMSKFKDADTYSIYICKIKCYFLTEYRYLLAFVEKNDFPLDSKELLSNIKWEVFQTRMLSDNYTYPQHEYMPNMNKFLSCKITQIRNDEHAATYTCDELPLVVTLLHKKAGVNEFQPKGTLVAALETYRTIITFNSSKK